MLLNVHNCIRGSEKSYVKNLELCLVLCSNSSLWEAFPTTPPCVPFPVACSTFADAMSTPDSVSVLVFFMCLHHWNVSFAGRYSHLCGLLLRLYLILLSYFTSFVPIIPLHRTLGEGCATWDQGAVSYTLFLMAIQ